MKQCKRPGQFGPSGPLGLGLLGLGLLGPVGAVAAEPVITAEDGLSLELLEFLADYGTDNGELALPETLDIADRETAAAPTDTQSTAPAEPAGKGEAKR